MSSRGWFAPSIHSSETQYRSPIQRIVNENIKQQGYCPFNLVKIGFEYALSNAFSDLWSIYSQQNIKQRCEPMAQESDDINMSMDSAIMRATVCLQSAYCC
ncbi:hypothetical protein L1987_63712 [Smallanthus sonchifolius]|uniref:Uncharacterized protein n=1 Tax=Smallanthus sonchifolius TaxID=185202 RepID=A0ACB9CEE0_9ASTR|nr:hypothetical protein L1987_63712 [Smallanthus sonchifolius]